MRTKVLVLLLGCVVFSSACGSTKLSRIHADAQYLQSELSSVCDVSLIPFAYYTNQQGLYERFGKPMAEMVMAQVR